MLCKVIYFDSHYHAYAICHTSKRSIISNILDHNVYHGHVLSDGLTYMYYNSEISHSLIFGVSLSVFANDNNLHTARVTLL